MSTPPPGCPRAASAPFERETVLRKPTRVGKRSRLRHSAPRKPTQVGKRSPSTPDRSRKPTCVGKRNRLRHSTPRKPTQVGKRSPSTPDRSRKPTCVGKRHRLRHSHRRSRLESENAAYGTAHQPRSAHTIDPTTSGLDRRTSHCVEATRTRHSISPLPERREPVLSSAAKQPGLASRCHVGCTPTPSGELRLLQLVIAGISAPRKIGRQTAR